MGQLQVPDIDDDKLSDVIPGSKDISRGVRSF